ncbi:MAG: hypothetical protein NVSMB7_04140 [Chitinophagaceae bacterium]
MKKYFQIFILSMFLVAFLTTTIPAKAGDHERHGERHDSDKGDSSRVPINGGIAVLLVAGIGFGVKKLIDRHNSNKEANSLI